MFSSFQWVEELTKLVDSLDTTTISTLFIRYYPLMLLSVVFWPITLTLVFAVASAWGWLFWLVTSLIFGIIQLFYVVYQFSMITIDIVFLSILKTYSVMRSQLLYYSVLSGVIREGRKSSRGREWRRKVDNANNYKEFAHIEIEEPSLETIRMGLNKSDGRQRLKRRGPLTLVTAMLRRSDSFSKKQQRNGSQALERSKSCLNLRDSKNSGINTKDEHYDSCGEPMGMVHSKSTGNIFSLDDNSRDDDFDIDPVEAQLGMTGKMLITTTRRLREARAQSSSDSTSALMFLLSGVVKRNHLSVDEFLLEDARSVHNSGQHTLSKEARLLIFEYMEEVERCLNWIADSPTSTYFPNSNSPMNQNPPTIPENNQSDISYENEEKNNSKKFLEENKAENVMYKQVSELSDRIKLLNKLKQNTGCTALMLSGGGAQAMYHAGSIRALLEANLYGNIPVISGTSGGSIVAAMCALKSNEELLSDVCVPNVSTDFMSTGQQKKENIRWFPTVVEMGAYWLKKKLLVDSREFKRCCDFYYGDVTFEEAFQRTGKHVCITVTASRATSGGGAQRLLLNHVSTPHVTLASSVACSCALPGVMAPAKLMTKDSNGNQEPFEVDGVEWIDGSVQADLPFRRISTLFNVSEYIVCQCNFHVVPFLNKAHHPSTSSFYWRMFQTCEWDIRNRALNLSRLGLFPKIFGQDISKVFKQKYHGTLTLVPRFTKMQVFGLKALSNPTVEDMKQYLQHGQIAAWPYTSVIAHMIRLENIIDSCISRLEARLEGMNADDMSLDGSMSTVSIGMLKRSRIPTRDSDRLERKIRRLQDENILLKRKIEALEATLRDSGSFTKSGKQHLFEEGEEKKENCVDDIQLSPTSSSELSEHGREKGSWDGLRRRSQTIPPNITLH